MYKTNYSFAIFAVVVLLVAAVQPVIARPAETTLQRDSRPAPSSITPATASALSALGQMRAAANQQQSFEIDVDALQNATPEANRTDTDGDGLYDSVEWILGTDFNNSDSDFDRLNDSYEARNNLDPLEPDSNGDGLSDYFEVTNVPSLDCDGDGFPNQWDFDNDGDNVTDTLDLSPFSKSSTIESFNFDIKTNGHPTYINFQLSPENPDNMMLPLRTWDWPYDSKGTMQDLDNSTDDIQIIPMLELTLNQVPEQSEVTDYGIGIFSDRAYVPLAQVQSRGATVALGGKMFYPASHPLDIRGNATLIWLVKAKTDRLENETILSENTTLVKYNERFALTGFSVEEIYRNDVGLFYSGEINQTIGANFLLAYAFLRNNQTSVYDMPTELADHNVSINSSIKSFSHRDLALLNITSRMTPAALNSLPENRVLPVIAAFESNFTKKELSELDPSPCIMGNNLSVDLRSEPRITMKLLKTSWYNTTTQEVLETEAVMAEMQDWGESIGLEEDTLSSMMRLALAWNVGESTVPRIGDQLTDFKAYEISIVEDLVTKIGAGKTILSSITDLLSIAVDRGQYLFTNLGTILSTWETLGKLFEAVAKTCTKLTKVLNAVSIALSVVGLVLDIHFALLGFFLISMSEGWSATGTLQGFIYATIMSTYAICLFLIGLIFFLIGMLGPVGEIIAIIGGVILIVIGVIDMILGFFGLGFSDFIAWVVSRFHRADMNVNVKLAMLNTSVDIDDSGKNGLNVGDRITFRSYINGTVTNTTYGTSDDVNESYIKPHYTIRRWMTGNYTPPAYWSSPYGSFTNQVAVYTDPEFKLKNTTYEVGAWMEPNWGTINFPFPILETVDYKIFYTDARVEWDVWNGYKYTRMNKTGRSTSELGVLYFDVLPGSINDFANWRQITSQDHDGDGLANSEDSCPWSWDCDGDGLSDNYELLIGTDPKNSDRDGDGLNDRMELIYGTNPVQGDTDGDNLSDYKEINGWVIDFNYSNQTFNLSVRSDPLMPDTDGDGVDDQMEYWSILNPRSKDSDGDDVLDVANPKYVTYVHFEQEWGSYGTGDGEFKEPNGIAVDRNGYVYVADTFNDRIQKFDSNGTFLTKWGTSGLGNGSFYYPWGLAVDANGSVYVIDDSHRIQIFDPNGTFITSWNGTSYQFHTDIAVANSHVYVPGVASSNNSTFKCIHKIDSNGTPITHWSIETLNDVTALAAGSGYVYVTDGSDAPNTGLYQFDSNGTYITKWGSEGYNVSIKPFSKPKGLAVDNRGFVYIADSNNHHIQKFASDGFFITRWGQFGSDQGNFTNPLSIAVDSKDYVYVTDGSSSWYRVQKFSQITALPSRNVSNTTDTDGDGVTDINETTGWNVTFTNVTGTFTLHATSEPLANDTDFDGLTDYGEFNHSSNPRDGDTDDDRLTDFIEYVLGTNLTHYDTDGDGLDDGIELIFGSDPTQNDSDNDGLFDYEEFEYLSDPKNNDTDGDGLNDLLEKEFNSSLRSPDSDGDLMFDGLEYNLSTDPWDPDSDGDELPDGYEVFFNTSPSINDTDSDGVPDGTEVDRRMDPLCNDTDGDGLSDSEELDLGTDPLNEDSDGDGIPDSEDFDSFTTFEEPVFLAYDPDPDSDEFVEKLNASLYNKSSNYTYLHIVSRNELLLNHSDAPYIVLVGRPAAEDGTVGSLIHDLLADSGDVLDQMLESDYDRFAVRYGLWNSTQTVVMLSHPYPSDHYSVLNMLKGMTVTIRPDSAKVVYPAPRDFFEVNTIDTLKETDAVITVGLDETVTPWITMSRHSTFTTPFALTHALGLARDEVAVGKYLEIELSEKIQNETGDIITGTLVKLYYTASDLDRTGDGDADDAGDINESTLQLYWFDESRGQWIKLSEDLEGVVGTGVDTNNVELYGKSYEGYVWANVAHSSLYGLAGNLRVARGGGGGGRHYTPLDSDSDGLSDVDELLNGTDPYNPDTDGDGIIDSGDPFPLDPTLPVQPAVTPSPPVTTPVTPSMTPAPVPTPTEVPATPTPEEPGFEVLMWLLAVAFVVLTDYVNTVKRRK